MQEFIGYIADVTHCNVVTKLLNMASLTSVTETHACTDSKWSYLVLRIPKPMTYTSHPTADSAVSGSMT